MIVSHKENQLNWKKENLEKIWKIKNGNQQLTGSHSYVNIKKKHLKSSIREDLLKLSARLKLV